jgi:murein DD-endopeptidase MepM/ murein hydrolase activator NlpD
MKKRNITLTVLAISGLVTVFTFVATNTMQKKNMQSLAIQSGSQIVLNATPTPKPSAKPPIAEKKTIEPKKETEAPKQATPAPTPKPQKAIMPVSNSEIISEFSSDALVFQETYGDYRAHLGIDILGDKNQPVLAVLDGIVTKNYFDYEEGITIEIEHPNGIKSIYKNLSTDKMAEVGKIVKQGDTISGIGDTGIFENHMPYHLHFEVEKNNEKVSPNVIYN